MRDTYCLQNHPNGIRVSIMKNTRSARLAYCALSIPVLLGLSAAATPEKQIPKISDQLLSQMDSDHDTRVSKVEFMEFGSEAMEKRGQRVDAFALEEKFKIYDRNMDGFITSADPASKTPEELLKERMLGKWIGIKGNGSKMEFVFMDDYTADLIQRGSSMREKAKAAGGDMTYRILDPTANPIALDMTARGQTGSPTTIQCIIRFNSDNEMEMRMAGSGPTSSRPREFLPNGSADAITLKRSM